LKGVTSGLTDGDGLEALRVAELALTLPVDGCHSHLVRRVGLQPRQHHGRWRERERERGKRERETSKRLDAQHRQVHGEVDFTV